MDDDVVLSTATSCFHMLLEMSLLTDDLTAMHTNPQIFNDSRGLRNALSITALLS